MTPIATKIEPKTMDSEISTLILSTPGYGDDQYPGHELRVANEFIKQHPEYEQSRTEVYVSYVRVLSGLKQDGKFPAAAPAPSPAPKVPPSPPQQAADSKEMLVQKIDPAPVFNERQFSKFLSPQLKREYAKRQLKMLIDKATADGKPAPTSEGKASSDNEEYFSGMIMVGKAAPSGKPAPTPDGKKNPPASSDGEGASTAKPDGKDTPVPNPDGKKSEASTPSPDGKGN